jgi:stearoyl-CoA desaturase (delta-9 desaturase)
MDGQERGPGPAYKFVVLMIVVLPFAATIYAIQRLWMSYVTPLDLGLMFSLYILSGLGITVGYHRLLTHRSFETATPLRALLLVLGSMAVEGPAIHWASMHIQHHAHSDQEGDPHSPLEGLWHAHIGWLFDDGSAQPEVYGAWLLKDRLVGFISKTFLLWVALGLLIPFVIGYIAAGWNGAWSGLLWGGLVRIFITHHITWSVNSVCHTFGSRMFHTKDRSYNNWVVGLLALGEGWHNNHHAFPRAAFHGMRWWQFDLSAYLIRLLAALGLAWNVWNPTREMQEKWSTRRPGAPAAKVGPAEAEA